jgi:glycosyltransferase involved in cell wall biosynthesis
MGRMMSYLANTPGQEVSYIRVESRGTACKLCSAWPMLKAVWRIWREAQAPSAAIVHLNMAERGSVLRKGIMLLWARSLGAPTVLHLHAAEILPFYDNLPRIGKRAVATVFRQANVCIVLGQPWRNWLVEKLAVDPSRIEVLRNGVPPPLVAPVLKATLRPQLVFLGNLLPRKGVQDLLTALATEPLASRPWDLIFAGGGDATSLRKYAEKLGLAPRVSFNGWLEQADSMALLSRSAALILPSYHEGLPLVLIEAASLGLVSVTTDVGAIAEVFSNEVTALIVTLGDIHALSVAILRVLDEPMLRLRIGANARKLFQRSLSVDVFASRLAKIYLQYCIAKDSNTIA